MSASYTYPNCMLCCCCFQGTFEMTIVGGGLDGVYLFRDFDDAQPAGTCVPASPCLCSMYGWGMGAVIPEALVWMSVVQVNGLLTFTIQTIYPTAATYTFSLDFCPTDGVAFSPSSGPLAGVQFTISYIGQGDGFPCICWSPLEDYFATFNGDFSPLGSVPLSFGAPDFEPGISGTWHSDFITNILCPDFVPTAPYLRVIFSASASHIASAVRSSYNLGIFCYDASMVQLTGCGWVPPSISTPAVVCNPLSVTFSSLTGIASICPTLTGGAVVTP